MGRNKVFTGNFLIDLIIVMVLVEVLYPVIHFIIGITLCLIVGAWACITKKGKEKSE